MAEKIEIRDLNESNVDDLIYVCSYKKLDDPIHQEGMRLKRLWLLEMLRKYGSIAKIAYYNDKPVAQILFFPETADVTKTSSRNNVLLINCIYNPAPEAQKKGIGTKLLQSLIQDAKHRRTCLGNKPCSFLLAKAFNTGELLPMPEFYRKHGFIPSPEAGMLFLPIEGKYETSPSSGEYKPLPEDRNKAIIFYGPICQFSFPFAKKIEEQIRMLTPQLEIKLINEWENPEESKKRKNWWLIVNAKPIHSFFMYTENFEKEIRLAVS